MRIKIFTTGGTIDKVYFDAKSKYEVGPPGVLEILGEANLALELAVEPIMAKDSLEMTDQDRLLIRNTIESETCPRIVITHGTDTMVQTALCLKGLAGKTIVLTGSMQPARFKATDAVFNIGMAIGAVQTLPAGVYIAMNGRVLDPKRARKNLDQNRFEEIAGCGQAGEGAVEAD
jgi:L-asparaginase